MKRVCTNMSSMCRLNGAETQLNLCSSFHDRHGSEVNGRKAEASTRERFYRFTYNVTDREIRKKNLLEVP